MKELLNKKIISRVIKQNGIPDFGEALIFEIASLVNQLEAETGVKYLRMEMGVPGFSSNKLAIKAEIAALMNGVSSVYPPMEGVPKLKKEASLFAKNFLNQNISPQGCIPTVGSTQGSFAAMMVACKRYKNKEALLFLDPGFPVQKQQMAILGHKYYSFDVYDSRGDLLRAKLESFLSAGDIGVILYSNPNNPAWICFTNDELKIIGELAEKYNVVVIEDLAYFGMDFRSDISHPGIEPYQPTVANYTSNYILLISSSKVFNYAGQRVALLLMSDSLFTKQFPDLGKCFANTNFGQALIFGALASLSSGTPHSAQYALYTILKSVNSRVFNFVESLREYEERAAFLKSLFMKYGFSIVYDMDASNLAIADGFYFTVAFPGMSGVELFEKLLYFGISLFPLNTTGSSRLEGARVCVSFVTREQYPELEIRLATFKLANPIDK